MTCASCGRSLADDARFCSHCGERVRSEGPAVDRLRPLLEQALGTHFRVERELGRGGMGVVYLAHEAGLDRDVAIKVLPPDKGQLELYRERFRREARTAARLRHPNVVPLHAFGEHEGVLYYVMGYVAGESLAEILKRGPLPEAAARRILAEVAGALHAAHEQGVVHRDVKPQNILIEAGTGRAMLTDFGISKLGDAANLTSTGVVVGTPDYMSPEQAGGCAEVGAASDIYSLGIVGYAMLSGRLPFEAATPGEAISRRLTSAAAPLPACAPAVSAALGEAIMRCLERQPERRWPDAASFAHAVAHPEDAEASAPRELADIESLGLLTAALVYLAGIFWTAWRATDSPGIAAELLGKIVPAVAGIVLLGVTAVALRAGRAGHSWRIVARYLLLEPRWWQSWYPRRWRRAANVWDRLPDEVRRTRLAVGATLVLGALWIPLLVAAMSSFPRSEKPPEVVFYPMLAFFAAMIVTFASLGVLGFRTPRRLRRQGLSDWESRRAAYEAPVSQAVFWSRPAVAALLRPAGAADVPAGETGTTQLPTATLGSGLKSKS